MNWFDLAARLAPYVKRGQTERAISECAKSFAELPEGPFHRGLKLDFSNSPQDLGASLDIWLESVRSNHPVGALYFEMNGFDINPDRWYFNGFSYPDYPGTNWDQWLPDYSAFSPNFQLTGMEDLQSAYQEYLDKVDGTEDESDGEEEEVDYAFLHEDTRDVASLLVVIKFQDLIRRTIPHMADLSVPVLATAHEYDFIACFRPR